MISAPDFYRAVEYKFNDRIQEYINSGGDVNVQELHKYTPGTTGCHNPVDRTYTALHYAVDSRVPSTNLVKFLLEKGANVNLRDLAGKYPINLVKNIDCLKLLLEYGADINSQDFSGRTVLDYCLENLEFAKYVFANINNIHINHKNTILVKFLNKLPTQIQIEDEKAYILKITELLKNYENLDEERYYEIRDEIQYYEGCGGLLQKQKDILYVIELLAISGANIDTLPEDLRALIEDKLKNRSKMCKGMNV